MDVADLFVIAGDHDSANSNVGTTLANTEPMITEGEPLAPMAAVL